ncbi:MAG: tetratricopeptide repeat protein [Dehalococcoidales bacterium]|nr:tetratricopeptide repeat protein [Dehalococcoidales bacterium]
MSDIRIHLSQIWFNPSYYDAGFDLLEEPSPNPKIDNVLVLGKLRTIDSVSELLTRLRSSYISHINDKVCAITRWSIERGANILVFPEYSIPIECLENIRDICSNNNMLTIAGTHRVRLTSETKKIYSKLGINLANIINGSAIAPLVYPNGDIKLAPKREKSKWEPNLNTSVEKTPVFMVELNGNELTLVVTPCIDSLHLGTFDFVNEESNTPNMAFCPALSPEINMFEDMGRVLSSHGIFFGMANSAGYGGTGFNIPEAWLPYISGVAPMYPNLPKYYEAIFEIDIESDSYFIKKGVVNSQPPCSHPKIFPIVYKKQNDWIEDFEKIREETLEMLRDGSPEEAIEWIDDSLSSQENALPETIINILKDCRHKYLTLYAGDIQAVEDMMTLVHMPDSIVDTRDLFARRIQEAIDILMETFRSSTEGSSTLMLNTLGALKTAQIQIGPPNPSEIEENRFEIKALNERISAYTYSPSDAIIAGFQDRGPILDELREVIGTGSERVIVITGMPGIGKTELINTLFLKVLTDWQPVWVNIATDDSVAKIVCTIGAILGITMDADSIGSSTDEIFRKQVKKLVSILYSTERNAFIVDDLKYLSMDRRNYTHLQILIKELANVEKYKGSRVFLISSVSSPPLWMHNANIARIHVRGLEDKFIRRVLEYQLREARLIPGESTADIPQSLLNIIEGHPLAAKIAAVASKEAGIQDLSNDIVTSEVEANIISLCLPKIELSPEELATAQLISVFRQPINIKTIEEHLELNVETANTLATKAVVEYDGHNYAMHPLIRKYYYKGVPIEEKKSFHKKAANYYSKTAQRNHLGHFINPTVAFELVYHLAMAGDFRELYDLRVIIYEAMYPAARTLYSQKQYDKALELFYKLAEIRPKEPRVWAYIGRCHGRRSQWNDCDLAFQKAIEVAEATKQPTSWIHRDWGHIRARFGFYDEAIPHLQEATRDNYLDPSSIACEAYMLWKKGDTGDAKTLFEKALKINPKHSYTLGTYTKMLDEMGEHSKYSNELKQRLSEIKEEMIEPDHFDIDAELDNEI